MGQQLGGCCSLGAWQEVQWLSLLYKDNPEVWMYDIEDISSDLMCRRWAFPEFYEVAGALDCSVGFEHVAFVTRQGRVRCFKNKQAELPALKRTAVPERPFPREDRLVSWDIQVQHAAAVRCGASKTVVLQRGGGGIYGQRAHELGVLSEDVQLWLRAHGRDSFLSVAVGGDYFAAVTVGGTFYSDRIGAATELQLDSAWPRLDRRPDVRRLTNLCCCCLVETDSGLLVFRPGEWLEIKVGRPDGLAFPLRCMEGNWNNCILVDAGGRVWMMEVSEYAIQWERVHLPHDVRAVRAVIARNMHVECPIAVVATVYGELLDVSDPSTCRSIRKRQPWLPRGLLPYGGSCAQCIVLMQDPCGPCGLWRCRMLFLIAERRGLLPGGEMRRAALVPFLVEDWIFEPVPEAAASPVRVGDR
eukprot:TRINITY_DN681_c1_g1_i1.p1 TRINITY_DN681_c1_g1~~TRINITY_DN681_c1_g1_i1.p1  ORF type:complete len:442 (+),score=86.23 TRINITY_DN681_c1_g1_i1:84-1328(+)